MSEPGSLPAWQRRAVDLVREVAQVFVDRACAHDVVLDFTGRAAPSQAVLGTWRYGFGDGAPLANGAPGTLARLYRVTADPTSAVILAEGWFRGPSNDSPGTGDVGDRVAGWCARVVKQVASGDRSVVDGPAVGIDSAAALLPPPSARPVLQRTRDAVERWRRRERWNVGIVARSIHEIVRDGAMPEPRWLQPSLPSSHYIADPFPIGRDGTSVTVLVEEYDHAAGRGRIVAIRATADGAVLDRSDWLAADHHLAYPFVFRDGPDAKLIPDAAATGTVRAYPLAPQAHAWTTLIDGFPGVDPTLLHHDGRWWLFCTRRDVENQTELHVFFASDWRGPWQPHALNPVKADARSSRPAGALYSTGGRLYRPAQDCSRRYGGALAINEIDELTPTRFREHVVATLRPEPAWAWPDGMHTINAIDDLVIVDGLRVER